MKKTLLLFTLVIFSISAFATGNFKKDKKALCNLIKNKYSSWSIPQNEGVLSLDTFEASTSIRVLDVQLANKNQVSNTPIQNKDCSTLNFTEFEFTIVNCQAIVTFKVDNQPISAFFEKNDGEWKLICAANLIQSS